MATAVQQPSAPAGGVGPNRPKSPGWIAAGFNAIYRFLASLKLAVISIATLAAVLGYATFFESWYGTAAVQQWIYQSPGFALLLAFLGANILCAALIRYPWKKRQIGFLITHTGLLVVLLGSWISFKVTDDGHVGMIEGADSSTLIRMDHAKVYVRPLDPETGEETKEFQLPFHPGAFAWDNPKRIADAAKQSPLLKPLALTIAGAFALGLVVFLYRWSNVWRDRIPKPVGVILGAAMALGCTMFAAMGLEKTGERVDVLTEPNEPFTLKVKEYYPASTPPRLAPVQGEHGVPMVKMALLVKAPRAKMMVDILDDRGADRLRWLVADNPRVKRDSRDVFPSMVAFQYLDSAEKVTDFLSLPENPLKDQQARIHYKNTDGKDLVYVWPIDGKERTVTLPESDLTVTYSKRDDLPLGHGDASAEAMLRAVGDDSIHIVQFKVRKGEGPELDHYGWGNLPMIPSVIPSESNPDAKGLVRIAYYYPPHISEIALQGRASVIEVAGLPDGQLFYRAFSREGLRGKGPVKVGETVDLVSGPGQPVSASFRVDEYLTKGVRETVCDPLVMPGGKAAEGIPAALVEMTVKDVTKKFWVRRAADLSQNFKTVRFPSGDYRVALDFDRKPLPFTVHLVDFDEGKDPGSSQSKSFKSEVILNDPSHGVENQEHTISMNRPLSYRDYTLYQSNFIPLRNDDDQFTGEVMSIFQTRYDPVWGIVYFGCLLVVMGTFVQFFMRAGVFSDGGKLEAARAAAKADRARARLAAKSAKRTADLTPGTSAEAVVDDHEDL
jgi:hypothetical protein